MLDAIFDIEPPQSKPMLRVLKRLETAGSMDGVEMPGSEPIRSNSIAEPSVADAAQQTQTDEIQHDTHTEHVYSEIVATSHRALEVIERSFADFNNVHLISQVAAANLTKQAEILRRAALDVETDGRTTIEFFGTQRRVGSIAEIEALLEDIRDDFERITQLDGSYESFVAVGLPIIDRYLFDGRNIERALGTGIEPRVAVFTARQPDHQQGGTSISEIDILPQPVGLDEFDGGFKGHSVIELDLDASAYALNGPISEFKELDKNGQLPEIVIIRMHGTGEPGIGKMVYQKHHSALQNFFIDYWSTLDPKDRPVIILYNDEGFDMPLYLRHMYEGFLIASGDEQFHNVYNLARDLVAAKTKPEFLEAVIIAEAQRRLYDNADLRQWESETADTYQSLERLLQYMFVQRAEAVRTIRETWGYPVDPERAQLPPLPAYTILDCGPGEGRISGALARLGFKVIGLDISTHQLEKVPGRIKEEGKGLRGETGNPNLTYHALQRLVKAGLIDEADIDIDDEATQARFLTVVGSFLDLHYELNQALIEWESRFPGVDKYDFFNISEWDEYAFSDERDMFMDVSFDMVTFNWHTLCEAGSIDNARNILRQSLNVLNPGGSIVIEVPDRLIDPYAASLSAYFQAHPDEPYGTIRDVTSTEPGVSTVVAEADGTARFFPDRSELVLLLQAVGFEIDPLKDVQTYLIDNTDPETGRKDLQVKELFITARKAGHNMGNLR